MAVRTRDDRVDALMCAYADWLNNRRTIRELAGATSRSWLGRMVRRRAQEMGDIPPPAEISYNDQLMTDLAVILTRMGAKYRAILLEHYVHRPNQNRTLQQKAKAAGVSERYYRTLLAEAKVIVDRSIDWRNVLIA